MIRSSPEPSSFRSANHPQGIRCAPFGGGSGPHPTVVAFDHAPLRGRIEPQVDTRLTALAELWLTRSRARFPRSGFRLDVVLIGRRHLTAALSTTCEVDELPLTSLVAPRARSGFWPVAFRVAPRTAPTSRPSRGDASSIQNVFHRRMPLEGPPPVARRIPRSCWYVGSKGPPPVSRLRRRAPASGAFSPHEALSRRGARPTFGPDGSSPKGECGPDVVRRLLQSRRFASTTTVRSNPAPPRARSPVRGASPGPRPPLSRRARSRAAGGYVSCPTSRLRAPP